MSQLHGSQLPPALLRNLEQGNLFRDGTLSLPVLTLDEGGWPHVAMAPGAVAAQPGELWTALGSKTGSLRNLERDGKVALLIAAPGTLYYVKGRAEVVRREMQLLPQEAAVRVTITEVTEDAKPFLEITSGISYQVKPLYQEFGTVLNQLLDELQALAEAK